MSESTPDIMQHELVERARQSSALTKAISPKRGLFIGWVLRFPAPMNVCKA